MGFLFFVAVVGAVIFMANKSSKATLLQWQTAASNLNLAYYKGGFGTSGTISGQINGHRIAVSTITKGSGNSSSTYTRYRVEYRVRVPVDLKITRQGMLHGIGKAFGLQDIEVGDSRLDDLVIIHGANPDKVRDFLSPELRDTIRHLAGTYKIFTITNEHVEIEKSGKDSDSAVIVHTVRRLAGLADEMMAGHKGAKPPKNVQPVEVRPSAMPVVEVTDPKKPVVEIVEPEVPVAEPPLNPLFSSNPVVPDPVDIEVQEEPVMEKHEPETLPEEISEHERLPTVDLQEAAEELFSDSGGSLLASKLFDNQFKNRKVVGAGMLKRVGKFSYDPIFPNTTGVKATVDVCELAGSYSKIKVTAEIKFQPEEYDSLKSRVGQMLPISGTLITQDAMLHQLYIVDE